MIDLQLRESEMTLPQLFAASCAELAPNPVTLGRMSIELRKTMDGLPRERMIQCALFFLMAEMGFTESDFRKPA